MYDTTSTDAGLRAGRREWSGLAVLVLPTLLVALEINVLFLALPHLSVDLGASGVQQLWIMTSTGSWSPACHHDGHARRPDRPRRLLMTGAAAFARLGRGRLLHQPEMLIVAPGAARDRRRDADALHPRADQQHVPRREAARRAIAVWATCHSPAPRSARSSAGAPRALLVGLGVPAGRTGDGGAAARGAGPAARVPQRDAGRLDLRQRRPVPGRDPADGLRHQAPRRRHHATVVPSPRSSWERCAGWFSSPATAAGRSAAGSPPALPALPSPRC